MSSCPLSFIFTVKGEMRRYWRIFFFVFTRDIMLFSSICTLMPSTSPRRKISRGMSYMEVRLGTKNMPSSWRDSKASIVARAAQTTLYAVRSITLTFALLVPSILATFSCVNPRFLSSKTSFWRSVKFVRHFTPKLRLFSIYPRSAMVNFSTV